VRLRITNPDGIANHTKIIDEATGVELQNSTSHIRVDLAAGGIAVADITLLASALDLVAELRSVAVRGGSEPTELDETEALTEMVKAHRDSAQDMLAALGRAGIVLARRRP
jgi:hypothetical protein